MERCSKMDILEKACYLLTTSKKSIFSKVAGPGLQSVTTIVDKINKKNASAISTIPLFNVNQ